MLIAVVVVLLNVDVVRDFDRCPRVGRLEGFMASQLQCVFLCGREW